MLTRLNSSISSTSFAAERGWSQDSGEVVGVRFSALADYPERLELRVFSVPPRLKAAISRGVKGEVEHVAAWIAAAGRSEEPWRSTDHALTLRWQGDALIARSSTGLGLAPSTNQRSRPNCRSALEDHARSGSLGGWRSVGVVSAAANRVDDAHGRVPSERRQLRAVCSPRVQGAVATSSRMNEPRSHRAKLPWRHTCECKFAPEPEYNASPSDRGAVRELLAEGGLAESDDLAGWVLSSLALKNQGRHSTPANGPGDRVTAIEARTALGHDF